MEKSTMTKLIADELKRIARGASGSAQNQLRMSFKTLRQHCLGKDPRQSPKEPFYQAVEQVRKNDSGFRPTLTDPQYFEWSD